MSKKLLAMLALLLCFGAVAVKAQEQEQKTEAQSSEDAGTEEMAAPVDAVVAKFEDGLKNTLENFKEKAGLDAEQYITATGIAKIGKAPTDRQYPAARQLAFNSAFAFAMQTIAGSIQQDMENAVSSGMISDSNGLKRVDMDNKIVGMVNDAIKKQLTAQGVDLSNPAAVKAAMPKVIESESFKQTTKAAAQLYLSGVVCVKTISQGDEVGVLAYYSPTMKKIADNIIARKSMPKIPKGINIPKYVRSIPAAELASTFGSRVYVNQKGEPCIVAFGQAIIRGNARIAEVTARRYADSFIQDFIGAKVSLSEMLDAAKDSATLEDAAGELTSTTDVVERTKSLASRGSKKLRYYGIKNLINKEVKLPSGHKIVVIGRMWSPALAQLGKKASDAGKKSEALREAVSRQDSAAKAPAARKKARKKTSVQPKRPVTPKYQDNANDATGAGGFVL